MRALAGLHSGTAIRSVASGGATDLPETIAEMVGAPETQHIVFAMPSCGAQFPKRFMTPHIHTNSHTC